ncbi:MAG: ion channel [Candidatus Thioglobus sp.]|uniref:ion channel n=1 Tax=Candidatus Thioglobus sp. TaxID=2026721 RepID=UPI0026369A37|nr:ion channel [Candidatus Thioglobus sp.]MDC9727425.1 ion channel [Candidatus Thioglobus sp.]
MWLAALINTIIVALSVLIHYEFLYRATTFVPSMNIKHRFRIVAVVFIALIAHVVEIWLFAIAYFYMSKDEAWGSIQGNFDGSLMDSVYFSFTNFSTLGFGDIEPFGAIRFLVGMEALVGFVLITWSASFLYFEMQRYWDSK